DPRVLHSTLSSHLSLFFFLLIPLPPRPTLFPYTTLFRSPMRCFAISFSMPGYWALATVANARKAIVVRETGEFMAAGFGTIVGKFLTGSNHFYTAAPSRI